MSGRNHVSMSQITMYCRCPAQYAFRYAEGLIVPPGIAAHVGSGVHAGAEHAMRYKSQHYKNASPDDVRDAAVAGFDTRLADDDALLTPDQEERGRENVVAESRDTVAALSHFWACAVQPEYQPESSETVERQFRVPLNQLGIDLLGFIDLEDDQHRVVDWKTGQRMRQADADTSLQLTCYAFAYHYRVGHPPSAVRFDCVRPSSHDPTTRVVYESKRDMADYQPFLDRVAVVVRSIRSGLFPPCNPDTWCCCPTWCGYWSRCPYVNPERAAKAQEKK